MEAASVAASGTGAANESLNAKTLRALKSQAKLSMLLTEPSADGLRGATTQSAGMGDAGLPDSMSRGPDELGGSDDGIHGPKALSESLHKISKIDNILSRVNDILLAKHHAQSEFHITERLRNVNVDGPRLEYLDRSAGTDTEGSGRSLHDLLRPNNQPVHGSYRIERKKARYGIETDMRVQKKKFLKKEQPSHADVVGDFYGVTPLPINQSMQSKHASTFN